MHSFALQMKRADIMTSLAALAIKDKSKCNQSVILVLHHVVPLLCNERGKEHALLGDGWQTRSHGNDIRFVARQPPMTTERLLEAPLGPMAIYLFNVKTFALFWFSLSLILLIDKEGLIFYIYIEWCLLTTPYAT
jgi:hypothetical protein